MRDGQLLRRVLLVLGFDVPSPATCTEVGLLSSKRITMRTCIVMRDVFKITDGKTDTRTNFLFVIGYLARKKGRAPERDTYIHIIHNTHPSKAPFLI